MSTQKVPAYTRGGDRVTFEDGISYTTKPPAPGETRASPEEMWAILSGNSAVPGSPAEIAEDQARRARKLKLGDFDNRNG